MGINDKQAFHRKEKAECLINLQKYITSHQKNKSQNNQTLFPMVPSDQIIV